MRIEDIIKQKRFRNDYEKVIVNLLYTSSWLNVKHLRILKPHGITIQQYNVLRILKGQYPNPASIQNIADRMIDKMSNASRLVDKLKNKNLVDRKASTIDRRQVEVKITDKGLQLLQLLETPILELSNKAKDKVSEQEVNQLSDLLDKFRGE
jgi:DNA-binding MarR family transcriptional regulator